MLNIVGECEKTLLGCSGVNKNMKCCKVVYHQGNK